MWCIYTYMYVYGWSHDLYLLMVIYYIVYSSIIQSRATLSGRGDWGQPAIPAGGVLCPPTAGLPLPCQCPPGRLTHGKPCLPPPSHQEDVSFSWGPALCRQWIQWQPRRSSRQQWQWWRQGIYACCFLCVYTFSLHCLRALPE